MSNALGLPAPPPDPLLLRASPRSLALGIAASQPEGLVSGVGLLGRWLILADRQESNSGKTCREASWLVW